jgi:hypothetical protein
VPVSYSRKNGAPDQMPYPSGWMRAAADQFHPVAGAGERARRGASRLGPPALQRMHVVGGELGEEAVHAEAVMQDPRRGPAAADRLREPRPWHGLVALRGDDLGAELVDDVMERMRTALGPERSEPVHDLECGEPASASGSGSRRTPQRRSTRTATPTAGRRRLLSRSIGVAETERCGLGRSRSRTDAVAPHRRRQHTAGAPIRRHRMGCGGVRSEVRANLAPVQPGTALIPPRRPLHLPIRFVSPGERPSHSQLLTTAHTQVRPLFVSGCESL